jgi:GTPase Era involved in 16S rRNA processing
MEKESKPELKDMRIRMNLAEIHFLLTVLTEYAKNHKNDHWSIQEKISLERKRFRNLLLGSHSKRYKVFKTDDIEEIEIGKVKFTIRLA